MSYHQFISFIVPPEVKKLVEELGFSCLYGATYRHPSGLVLRFKVYTFKRDLRTCLEMSLTENGYDFPSGSQQFEPGQADEAIKFYLRSCAYPVDAILRTKRLTALLS